MRRPSIGVDVLQMICIAKDQGDVVFLIQGGLNLDGQPKGCQDKLQVNSTKFIGNKEFRLQAAADGHGVHGHEVAEKVLEHIGAAIQNATTSLNPHNKRDVFKALKAAALVVNKNLEAENGHAIHSLDAPLL